MAKKFKVLNAIAVETPCNCDIEIVRNAYEIGVNEELYNATDEEINATLPDDIGAFSIIRLAGGGGVKEKDFEDVWKEYDL